MGAFLFFPTGMTMPIQILDLCHKEQGQPPDLSLLFFIYAHGRGYLPNLFYEVRKVLDELKPDIGKGTFAQHQIELEQGLRQVANALGSGGETDIPGFFRDFMAGFWNPFEELCDELTGLQKGDSEKILVLEHTLMKLIPPEQRRLLEQYSGLLIDRNNVALDYAFLFGYQCAFRFILMGIVPASKFLKEETEQL